MVGTIIVLIKKLSPNNGNVTCSLYLQAFIYRWLVVVNLRAVAQTAEERLRGELEIVRLKRGSQSLLDDVNNVHCT